MFSLYLFRKLIYGSLDDRVRITGNFLIWCCLGAYIASAVHWTFDTTYMSINPVEWAIGIAMAVVVAMLYREVP